jgi:pimeloyl-ACP methyl ester carboxylesterase
MKIATHRIPGLILTDHEFEVPLDHTQLGGEKITVFAREVVSVDKEGDELPWLVFLQGGPGFGSPRPEAKSGWLKRALKDYRVLLLDQRGTGRSTPVLAQTLTRFPTPQAGADYLMHFRADAIVHDAEWIRNTLIGEDRTWSLLGQSYGGFCAVRYLSDAPQGLKEVIITGGLPPLTGSVDDIYRATYRQVLERNDQYYQRYPADAVLTGEIVAYLLANDVRLPTGGRLTPLRFQQLGIAFGFSNGFEQVHYLLEGAFVGGTKGVELSYAFLRGVENAQPFETNPIYAILHEPIYCQETASNWSAERIRAEYPQFDISPRKPLYFTGEMIYPWMFDEYDRLHPLKEAAEILASYDRWPILYDVRTLQENQVPSVAAVYYNDMYVERTLSVETAANIQGIKLWITNEHEHSALRLHGEEVLDHLLGLLHGER